MTDVRNWRSHVEIDEFYGNIIMQSDDETMHAKKLSDKETSKASKNNIYHAKLSNEIHGELLTF